MISDSRRVEWCAIQGSSSWEKKVDSVLRSKITFSELFPCESRSSCDEPGTAFLIPLPVEESEKKSRTATCQNDETIWSIRWEGPCFERRECSSHFSAFFYERKVFGKKEGDILNQLEKGYQAMHERTEITLCLNFALAAPYTLLRENVERSFVNFTRTPQEQMSMADSSETTFSRKSSFSMNCLFVIFIVSRFLSNQSLMARMMCSRGFNSGEVKSRERPDDWRVRFHCSWQEKYPSLHWNWRPLNRCSSFSPVGGWLDYLGELLRRTACLTHLSFLHFSLPLMRKTWIIF